MYDSEVEEEGKEGHDFQDKEIMFSFSMYYGRSPFHVSLCILGSSRFCNRHGGGDGLEYVLYEWRAWGLGVCA